VDVRIVSDVTFRLFGSPVIQLGQGEIALRPERRFQLLAYLGACSAWIGRDQLAHLFWSEHDNASARRNLRVLLHSLQELGPIEGLEVERERVRLQLQTDLAAFERAIAGQQWSHAIDLYRGQLLAGMEEPDAGPFRQWLQGLRPRAADDFRNAALKWIDENPAAHVQHEALSRRLLEQDPFDERAAAISLQVLLATAQVDVAKRRYHQFAQRLLSEMGLEPGMELRALASRWSPATGRPARQAITPDTSERNDNPFIGRERELEHLASLLDDPACRLVTIHGPGGVGKSRLATELSARRHALALVALEALSVPAQIPAAVAAALGLRPEATTEFSVAVAAHLAQRDSLLVLDNFEHLADGAKFVQQWLQACQCLKVVVTSRELLEIENERAFVLEGLAVPPPGLPFDKAAACDAVRLFVDRASRSKQGFDFAREQADVLRIVALVEGMPLALELAAAWTRLMPCEAIAADLQDGIDVLATEGPERRVEHRSLRACLEHSWALLLPRECDVLARLSVFRGDFALSAARIVADAQLPALASLVDKSLLRALADGRFSLHPLVQRFSAEKLRAVEGALLKAHSRHATLYLELLARCMVEIRGGRQTLASIEAEFDNFLAAWWWALGAARFDLLVPVSGVWVMYFETRGRIDEGFDFYQRTSDAPAFSRAPVQLRARVEHGRAVFLMRRGERAEAERLARSALRRYRGLRDAERVRACLNLLGMLAWQQGAYLRARRYFEEGAKRAVAGGREEWRFVCNLALATQSCGDYDKARALFERSAANARRRADSSDLAPTLSNLGNLCVALNEFEEAQRYLLEAVELSHETGGHLAEPYALVDLAIIEIEFSRMERASEYLERALASVGRMPDQQVHPMCLYTMARIETAAGRFVRARELLAEAAQIAVRSENLPNMIGVAIWAAANYAREGDPVLAGAMLTVLVSHPDASRHERTLAQRLFDALGRHLDEATLAAAQARAVDEQLPRMMSRVIAAARRQHGEASSGPAAFPKLPGND
jgi:predicted ATPase/DNA-binding SARP family transcriptional activator